MVSIYQYDNSSPGRYKCGLKPGFTLIELMIALVIIGLIAGGAFYFAMTYLETAKRSATKTSLRNLKVTLLNYRSEKGEYPKTLQELVQAGFLKKAVPKDAWEHSFVYRLMPEGEGKEPYELYSYGPQGKGGGKASRLYAD